MGDDVRDIGMGVVGRQEEKTGRTATMHYNPLKNAYNDDARSRILGCDSTKPAQVALTRRISRTSLAPKRIAPDGSKEGAHYWHHG